MSVRRWWVLADKQTQERGRCGAARCSFRWRPLLLDNHQPENIPTSLGQAAMVPELT